MLSFLLIISDEKYHPKIEKIYNRYHDDMIRLAVSKLKQLGVSEYVVFAEDVVQNAFVKIIKYIDLINWDFPETHIKSYIFTIISNEAKNLQNDLEPWKSCDKDVDLLSEDDFIRNLDIKNSFDKVVEAIKRMDEKYSSVLMLYYCHEISVKEISNILGLSPKTIYTRIARGKVLLLKEIKEEDFYV